MAVHGTRRRESVSWDYAGLLQLLGNVAADRTRLPLLRSYWYEATAEGRRTAEHDTLGDLPGVKVRVARVRPGRRPSVEGEIHRDLTALARNKAVSDVMVVSGEEDLTEVISDVQDMGMRVTLLHIAADGEQSVPRALRQECDDVMEVSAAHLRPYVELISGAEPPRADESEEKQAAPRPAAVVNGNVNGNANGNGHAPAQTRAEEAVSPAPQPTAVPAAPAAQGDQGQPEHGDPEHGDTAAAAEYEAVPDFAANANYSASVDYGSVPDYAPPAPPRENIYPAPVAVPGPADDLPGHRDRLSARPGLVADPAAYNPGAVREPYQRDAGDAGDRDRLQPVPAVGSGSAQIRRLPTRGPGSAGPNQGQPPLGLPPAPLPPAPLPPAPVSPAATPVSGTPGAPAAETGIGQFPPVQLAGAPRPGGQFPAGQPAPGQPTSAQVTGAHPVAPVAPVVPMDTQNGMAYLGAHSVTGGPRQGAQGLAGPQPAVGPQGGQPDRGGQSGPLGLVPPANSVGPANMAGQANSISQANGSGGYPAGLPGVSLADAVQSAHEEGQAFGESVARDAPALWLEAVLARKPRMPSDLEARLLQGSALPIDFLLHDEVRHALRRGFWDALERARR